MSDLDRKLIRLAYSLAILSSLVDDKFSRVAITVRLTLGLANDGKESLRNIHSRRSSAASLVELLWRKFFKNDAPLSFRTVSKGKKFFLAP